MICTIISGGQSGADIAAWRAARTMGLPTTGYMPRGFLTEDGLHPEYRDLYGAIELESLEYPTRTRRNVAVSDGLIWFGDHRSAGGRLTLGECRKHGLPVLIVPDQDWIVDDTIDWLVNDFAAGRGEGGETGGRLMIAGNRASKSPGIESWVERHLVEVFRLLKERGEIQ